MILKVKSVCDKCVKNNRPKSYPDIDSLVKQCKNIGNIPLHWDKILGLCYASGNQILYCRDCVYILEHLVLAEQDEIQEE